MREIKFRGRDVEDGILLTGHYIYDETTDKYYILPYGNFVNNNKESGILTSLGWEVLKETLGQYTGLKDKNGVEIYEGDILEFYEELYTVIWDEDDAMFSISNHSIIYDFGQFHSYEVSICGNIYENPELLES